MKAKSAVSSVLLQAKVSEALDALPRGREPASPGERFRHDVLAAMPDIEAMELVEHFFTLGKRIVGSPNPIAIFLAGCRECLPDGSCKPPGPHADPPQRQIPPFAHVGKRRPDPHAALQEVPPPCPGRPGLAAPHPGRRPARPGSAVSEQGGLG
jgi:hypothetical protein